MDILKNTLVVLGDAVCDVMTELSDEVYAAITALVDGGYKAR